MWITQQFGFMLKESFNYANQKKCLEYWKILDYFSSMLRYDTKIIVLLN